MGTVNLLEACRTCSHVRAVVVITTDKVYENREKTYAFNESDPLGGRDPYSASKACADLASQCYISSFFTKDCVPSAAIARAGNVIGGGDWAEWRIVPDCIRALRRDKPIVLRNPRAVRPWQHVLEPLYGYLCLAAALVSDRRREASGAWNFGPAKESVIPVIDLVKSVVRLAGKGTYLVEQDPKALHEAAFLQLDISKATNILGWSPVLDIEQAIEWTVQEYESKCTTPEKWLDQRIEHIRQYMAKIPGE
jgi:CDP-glucose 4,6-dehydratase